MKKRVWILNHYATNMFFNEGGRHYWFARFLREAGYEPIVFCANTQHSSQAAVNTEGKPFITKEAPDKFSYVFMRSIEYAGNGPLRVLNMFLFMLNLLFNASKVAISQGKPDIILASSVHPLTLIAGIFLAKKFKVKCICEIRDLWPESFLAFKIVSPANPIMKLLYWGEKWIYTKADYLIFTMEGGKQYIKDKGWDTDSGGSINLNKVYHINNGVDLKAFNENIKNHIYEDEQYNNTKALKLVYTGAIRQVNNLGLVIDAINHINHSPDPFPKIELYLFGDGTEKDELTKYCQDKGINNVFFKGRVNKKFIPNILSKSDLNIIGYASADVFKYGVSHNKLFEYLAAGKPILSLIQTGFDILLGNKVGTVLEEQTSESIADGILKALKRTVKNTQNLHYIAEKYDFRNLTNQLIQIIEKAN
jgi:glycosyltransferase involved in cell wall biosynthesis